MNFGGHLITGWLISKIGDFNHSERRFITIMGILPDLDAFSVLSPDKLGDWHRTFGHNIFFGLAAPITAFLFFKKGRGLKILPFALASIFVHYILDLVITGWWAFYPFWPLNKNFTILTSLYIPENVMKYYLQIGLFIILLFIVIMIYRKSKTTPLEIISPDFDKFITTFITSPFRQKCSVCGSRAFYLCSETGKYICGKHVKFLKGFKTKCVEKK